MTHGASIGIDAQHFGITRRQPARRRRRRRAHDGLDAGLAQNIDGPVEQIGEKVGAALVGTFLGILLSYGFMSPLSVNMEFISIAEMTYLRCIATAVNEFANGMAPIMAVESARRSLSGEMRGGADEMETMLKAINTQPKT